MEGLGRIFNIIPTGDAAYVSMRDCAGVTFLCVGANAETFTLAEAKDASGTGSQTLATITTYHANSAAVGATTWSRQTIAAGGVVTTTTALPVAAIHVSGAELSDTYDYLRVSSSSTGTVVVITHDLASQREPANLPALAV